MRGPSGRGGRQLRPDRWGAAGSPREKELCVRGRRLAVCFTARGPGEAALEAGKAGAEEPPGRRGLSLPGDRPQPVS